MHSIKHHIIYKTTCHITGKFYVGMHTTDNLDDGYLGSGINLTLSCEQHGVKSHTRIILEHCSSREELKQREAEIVNEKLLKDKMCMNIALGGGEGWDQINSKRTPEEWKAIQRLGYLAMAAVLTPEQRSNRSKNSWKNPTQSRLEIVRKNLQYGTKAAATPEVNAKRKATLAEMKHQQGELNAQYGKVWVTNGEVTKAIKQEQLKEFESSGYILGRKIKEPIQESQKVLLERQRQEDYLRLLPRCRNLECLNQLSYHAFRKKRSSCSKTCSNKTRVLG